MSPPLHQRLRQRDCSSQTGGNTSGSECAPNRTGRNATVGDVPSAKPSTTLPSDTSARPITGPAKNIVENMEQSLTVPTATSFRNIPVKLLEENRRIINEHLQAQGRGKVSFTHLIALGDHQGRQSLSAYESSALARSTASLRGSNTRTSISASRSTSRKRTARGLCSFPTSKAADKMNFRSVL